MVDQFPSPDAAICLLKVVDMEKQILSIQAEVQMLSRAVDAGAKSCDKLKKLLASPECASETVRLAQRAIARFYTVTLTHTYALYEAVTIPNLAGGLLNPRIVQYENYENFSKEIEGVFSFVKDRKLYIKTPPLPAKINHGIRQSGQGTVGKPAYIFNRTVDASLSKIDPQIPHFSEQNIAYLTVFPANCRSVPDCENIDTKSITDMICLHTMCDDSPAKTSFFCAGFADDSLDYGTYICVSEGRFSVPNINMILMTFRQNEASKKV